MNSLASADILDLLEVKEGFVFQLGNGVGRLWFVKVCLRSSASVLQFHTINAVTSTNQKLTIIPPEKRWVLDQNNDSVLFAR